MRSANAIKVHRKSGEAERRDLRSADPSWECFSTERTRISCHEAPDKVACAPFFKERRMMFASATNLYRKSSVAEWRDLRFS
jgi:hypothetical protein